MSPLLAFFFLLVASGCYAMDQERFNSTSSEELDHEDDVDDDEAGYTVYAWRQLSHLFIDYRTNEYHLYTFREENGTTKVLHEVFDLKGVAVGSAMMQDDPSPIEILRPSTTISKHKKLSEALMAFYKPLKDVLIP